MMTTRTTTNRNAIITTNFDDDSNNDEYYPFVDGSPPTVPPCDPPAPQRRQQQQQHQSRQQLSQQHERTRQQHSGSSSNSMNSRGMNQQQQEHEIEVEVLQQEVVEAPSSTSFSSSPSNHTSILQWHDPHPPMKLYIEKRLLKVLLRWNHTERGMMKDQPSFRLDEIQRAIRKLRNAGNQEQGGYCTTLPAALSLRRHYIQKLNPNMSKYQLRLGTDVDIRTSAQYFELAVETVLKENNIVYYTEQQQRQKYNQEIETTTTATTTGAVLLPPRPPTPDFLLQQPIRIQKIRQHHEQQQQDDDDDDEQSRGKSGNTTTRRQQSSSYQVIEEQTINWIEAKMFYGASCIEQNNRSAVGTLCSTARKYVNAYGTGAIVFMQGYGYELQKQLNNMGVMILSCQDSKTIDLQHVQQHQRTWCADSQGNILP